MEAERLAAAFLAALPAELRDSARTDPGLGGELAALVAAARRDVPGVSLDAVNFVTYLAERAMFDRAGRAQLGRLHGDALWIACGCVARDPAAIAAFEARYAPEITAALRSMSIDTALAQDAELKLRERLFLVDEADAPRLASYSGRGDLRAWLRAAAVRTAIDELRARRVIPVDPAELGDAAAAVDPVLAGLKERYREEFRAAFAAAAGELTDRERTLLRYRFVDGLSIDEIGRLFRVHRATVARWIAGIREALFDGTRTELMRRLAVSDSEVDSILRWIDSQLDASVELLLAPAR